MGRWATRGSRSLSTEHSAALPHTSNLVPGPARPLAAGHVKPASSTPRGTAASPRRPGRGRRSSGRGGRRATVRLRSADLSDGRQRVLGRVVRAAAVGDAGGGAAGPQDALGALRRGGLQAEEVQRQVEAGRQQAGQRRAAAQRHHRYQQRREGAQQALPVAQHGASGAHRAAPNGTGPADAATAAASPQGKGDGDAATPSASQPALSHRQPIGARRSPAFS